jgi:DNA-binding response OmpR family regulator
MKREGFSVAEATSVEQAMSQLSPEPDWILLDLMLPDGSGLRVLEHVKQSAMATRICVISGCHQALIDQALRAGADAAFVKPLEVSRVIAAMVS